jgi:hypothetical protein
MMGRLPIFFAPLGIFPLFTPLDWALFCLKDIGPVVGLLCEGNEDQVVALLTAIEEDHSRAVKGASSRGRRELLNLECSITMKSCPQGVGKARLTFFLR